MERLFLILPCNPSIVFSFRTAIVYTLLRLVNNHIATPCRPILSAEEGKYLRCDNANDLSPSDAAKVLFIKEDIQLAIQYD